MRTYAFEKLACYKQAKELAVWVYTITKEFPKQENYGITSQMKRSAVSVVSNLAEGSTRKSFKDQANFSVIAYSSLMELLSQMTISFEVGLMSREQYSDGRNLVERLSYVISKFRDFQLANANKLTQPSNLAN